MTELLGRDRADTLMESLPPVSWDQIATKADLAAQTAKVDGQFAELRGAIEAMEGRMERRIASQTYVMLFGTLAMVAAGAGSIWAAILLNPLG